MRLFVAIDVSDEIRQSISAYVAEILPLAPEMKWVDPDNMHVTLKFIGESQQREAIEKSLADVRSQPFAISFRGVGFFTPRSPRVLWAGVQAADELAQLTAVIEKRINELGIPPEEHEYNPHLTLARAGSGRPQGTLQDRNKATMSTLRDRIEAAPRLLHPDFGTMLAQDFYLYRSETLPSGPRYSKLARFPLN